MKRVHAREQHAKHFDATQTLSTTLTPPISMFEVLNLSDAHFDLMNLLMVFATPKKKKEKETKTHTSETQS